MPIVSSLGGNAGTQTLAVAVRALASRELNAANAVRIIWRELGVGLFNGATLAMVMAAASIVLAARLEAVAVVGLALMVNLFVAALGGILGPWPWSAWAATRRCRRPCSSPS
jgi:magnesium transporter